MKFNISKGKHVATLWTNSSYYLNGIKIDSVKSQNDLGILFDHQLKFHPHTTDVAAEANRLLGLIRKSFNYLDPDMLVKLFVTACCPSYFGTLQFGMGLLFILNQRKIEKIQRRATRLLSLIRDRPYGERLLILQSPFLAYRCLIRVT